MFNQLFNMVEQICNLFAASISNLERQQAFKAIITVISKTVSISELERVASL